ncbi:hypothetical protein [Klebsiella phage 05F01]|nr:hypothetical protein [Klebsiella phage 05F01]
MKTFNKLFASLIAVCYSYFEGRELLPLNP